MQALPMVLLLQVLMRRLVLSDDGVYGDGDGNGEPHPFSQIIWVGWLNARGKEVGRGRFLPIQIFDAFCCRTTLFNIWLMNTFALFAVCLAVKYLA